jgi:hypothetical protein
MQFSPEDGVWPENKGGLLVVKDVQSAAKALGAIAEGFNPGQFAKALASIDKAAFLPVVPNPSTSSYEGKKFYEVSEAMFLFFVTDNVLPLQGIAYL